MRARVALVLVSHSHQLAAGVAELAAQMAPGVLLLHAGGTVEQSLGTDFGRVSGAVSQALAASPGVLVLADLGSAILTAESVIEMLPDEDAARVCLADAPFVEGAVAAAVTAHGGGSLVEVLDSAEHAGSTFSDREWPPASRDEAASASPGDGTDGTSRSVVLRNPLGLHARPAAVLARLIAGFDACLTVNGVNGASILELMKLGATGGQQLDIAASGAQAAEAVAAVASAVEGGFGEV